jgi:hypothetical protein
MWVMKFKGTAGLWDNLMNSVLEILIYNVCGSRRGILKKSLIDKCTTVTYLLVDC